MRTYLFFCRQLFSRLFFLLVLCAICRLFFVTANKNEFNVGSIIDTLPLFIYGIRFDLSAIFLINSLFIVLSVFPHPYHCNKYYNSTLKFLFVFVNSFFLLLNLIDVAYFPFIHKRMQADVFGYINGKRGNEFYQLLPKFLTEYWYLWLTSVLFVFLIVKFYNLSGKHKLDIRKSFRDYCYASLLFILTIGISIVSIRGGFQMKPLSIIHAAEMTEVQNSPVILNTAFTILTTFKKKNLSDANFLTESEIEELYNKEKKNYSGIPFNKKNVVVIIVESLSKNHIGFFSGNKQTPFLDSLFRESMVFTNAFANAKESIQGIPAITASIPSWQDDPFIFSPYSGNRITSIANTLKKEDYNTSFFHGASNGSMGFDSYCKLAGFDEYYGRKEYNNEKDFDGEWGIWDHKFLENFCEQLTQKKEPFFSTVFTLNTHHPFTIPTDFKDEFKQEGHPFLTCVRYADYSLSSFFDNAKKTAWFKNTIFVITADHTSPIKLNNKNKIIDDYGIPITFYDPNGSFKGTDDRIANQIDILPSVLYLLNYPHDFFSLGNNLFDKKSESFSINYNSGIYEYIDTSYCYQFNGIKGLSLFNWKKDTSFQNNIISKVNDEKRSDNLKKMIQLFNYSMINNKLFLK